MAEFPLGREVFVQPGVRGRLPPRVALADIRHQGISVPPTLIWLVLLVSVGCMPSRPPAEPRPVPWGPLAESSFGVGGDRPLRLVADAHPVGAARRAQRSPDFDASDYVADGGPSGSASDPEMADRQVAQDTPAEPGDVHVLSDELLQDEESEEDYERGRRQFAERLRPYGAWVDDPFYGLVWIPSRAIVGRGFVPYVTGGHWALSAGRQRLWVSDFAFGWVTFHHGRWARLGAGRWGWVPGYRYAPAWASFARVGAYWGWRPLPPRYARRNGVWVAHRSRWRQPLSFCRSGDLYRRGLSRYVVRDAKRKRRLARKAARFHQPVPGATHVRPSGSALRAQRAAQRRLRARRVARREHASGARARAPRAGARSQTTSSRAVAAPSVRRRAAKNAAHQRRSVSPGSRSSVRAARERRAARRAASSARAGRSSATRRRDARRARNNRSKGSVESRPKVRPAVFSSARRRRGQSVAAPAKRPPPQAQSGRRASRRAAARKRARSQTKKPAQAAREASKSARASPPATRRSSRRRKEGARRSRSSARRRAEPR